MKPETLVRSMIKGLTISDRIFIGLALLVLTGFYLFFKRDVTYITARFKVTDENILYAQTSPTNEFASSFQAGDTERDELGRVTSEIVRVKSYKVKPEQQVVYLDIKLKAIYNPRKNLYTVRGKNILFGESVNFSFSKVTFKATVVDFPGYRKPGEVKETTTTVKAQLRAENRYFSDTYGVPDFVAGSVKTGDVVKDSEGVPLVTVKSVTVTPAKRLVVGASGQPFIVDDPYLKDVSYVLDLSTKEINNTTYMFDYIPVLVNAYIPINLSTTSIFPIITEIVK